MKINWDTIITTVATFAAEFASAYWLLRKTRAQENPTTKPPSRWTGIIGRTKYLTKKYWPAVVALALPMFGILWELSRPGPVDDVSVFFIVLFTIALSFEVSMLGALALYARLSRHVVEMSEDLSKRTLMIVEAMKEQDEQTFEVFKAILETFDAFASRKEPGAIDRLRGTVKKLLGADRRDAGKD